MKIFNHFKPFVLSIFVLTFMPIAVNASAKERLQAKKKDLLTRLEADKAAQYKATRPQIIDRILAYDPKAVNEEMRAGADLNFVMPNGRTIYELAKKALELATTQKNEQAIINAQLILQMLDAHKAKDADQNDDEKKQSTPKNKSKKKKSKSKDVATATATGPSESSTEENNEKESSSKDVKINDKKVQSSVNEQNIIDSAAKEHESQAQESNANPQKSSLSLEEKKKILRLISVTENSTQIFAYLTKQASSKTRIITAVQNMRNSFLKYFSFMKKNHRSFEFSLSFFNPAQLVAFQILLAQSVKITHPQIDIDHPDYGLKVLRKIFNEASGERYIENDLMLVLNEKLSPPIFHMLMESLSIKESAPALVKELLPDLQEADTISHGDLFGLSEDVCGEYLAELIEQHEKRFSEMLKEAKFQEADERFAELLFNAVIMGHRDDTKLLLRTYRANPNARDAKGRVPLLLAWDPGINKMLIEAGASINFQDVQGCTALMTACQAGDALVVQDLLREKANFKLKDKDGKTAYALAHESVRKLLDECGAGEYEFKLQAQKRDEDQAALKQASDEKLHKETQAEQLRLDALAAAQKAHEKEQRQREKKEKKAAQRQLRKEEERAQLNEIEIKRREKLKEVAKEQPSKANEESANLKEKANAEREVAQKLAAQENAKKQQAAQKRAELHAKAGKRAAFNKMRKYSQNELQEENQRKEKQIHADHIGHSDKHDAPAVEAIAYNYSESNQTDFYSRLQALQNAIGLMNRQEGFDKGQVKKNRAYINLWDSGKRFVGYFSKIGYNSEQTQAFILGNENYAKLFNEMHALLKDPKIPTTTLGIIKHFTKKARAQSGTESVHAKANALFFDAVKSANLPLVEQMCKTHPTNCLDERGCSPLFYASLGGHAEIAQVLMKSGADVELYNKKIGVHPRQVASDKMLAIIDSPHEHNQAAKRTAFSALSQQEKAALLNARLAESLAGRAIQQ